MTPGDLSDEASVPIERILPLTLVTDGADADLWPFWIAWSPDGRYLLAIAWGAGNVAVAASVDATGDAVLLWQGDSLVAYDAYDATIHHPIHVWAPAFGD